MSQRITKKNVLARYDACKSMAERVGIDTSTWDLQVWNGDQYICVNRTGHAPFGDSGGVFANGAREAYNVMGGFLAGMRLMDESLTKVSNLAKRTGASLPISAKHLNVYALPIEVPRTINVQV